jgi:hypothetical protein
VPQYSVINPQAMVNGEPEDISVVRTNFEAIAQTVNKLDDSNIAANANIQLSKLAGSGSFGGIQVSNGNLTVPGAVTIGGSTIADSAEGLATTAGIHAGSYVSAERLQMRQGANLAVANGELYVSNGLHLITSNPGAQRIQSIFLDVGSGEGQLDGDLITLVNRAGASFNYGLLGNLRFLPIGDDFFPHGADRAFQWIYVKSESKWQMVG